jgi:hypothetical protein
MQSSKQSNPTRPNMAAMFAGKRTLKKSKQTEPAKPDGIASLLAGIKGGKANLNKVDVSQVAQSAKGNPLLAGLASGRSRLKPRNVDPQKQPDKPTATGNPMLAGLAAGLKGLKSKKADPQKQPNKPEEKSAAELLKDKKAQEANQTRTAVIVNDKELDVLKKISVKEGVNLKWGDEVSTRTPKRTFIIQQKVGDEWKRIGSNHPFSHVKTFTKANFISNDFVKIGQTFEENGFRITLWHKDLL